MIERSVTERPTTRATVFPMSKPEISNVFTNLISPDNNSFNKLTWVAQRLKREHITPGPSEALPLLGDDGPDGDVVVRHYAPVLASPHPVRVQVKVCKVQLILMLNSGNLRVK